MNLNKIYALVSNQSASASEATLVSLMPFMDVEVIGKQTGAKHCTGVMLTAEGYYEYQEALLEYYKALKDDDDFEPSSE